MLLVDLGGGPTWIAEQPPHAAVAVLQSGAVKADTIFWLMLILICYKRKYCFMTG
jgi:hypothetical protein